MVSAVPHAYCVIDLSKSALGLAGACPVMVLFFSPSGFQGCAGYCSSQVRIAFSWHRINHSSTLILYVARHGAGGVSCRLGPHELTASMSVRLL